MELGQPKKMQSLWVIKIAVFILRKLLVPIYHMALNRHRIKTKYHPTIVTDPFSAGKNIPSGVQGR